MAAQVFSKRVGTAQPRWGWSGVDPIPDLKHLTTPVANAVSILPNTQSAREQIVCEILQLFGTVRAEAQAPSGAKSACGKLSRCRYRRTS